MEELLRFNFCLLGEYG